MKSILSTGLWWLLVCCVPHDARSAELSIQRWTGNDGLPQNRISALAQTPDGYLWCGTWFGLARFDGLRFAAFDHNRVPAFHHDAVNALAVDAVDGALWVGTRDGLLRFARGTWQRFGTAEGLPGPIVWRLLPRSRGGVWLDCEGRVAIATSRGLQWISAPIDVPPNDPQGSSIRQLVADAADTLTFLTDHGPRRIRNGDSTASPLAVPGFTNHGWRAVLLDADGRVEFAGTEEGLAARTDGGWIWIARSGIGRSELSSVLHRGPSGEAWAAPRTAGLGRIENHVWKPVVPMPGHPPTDMTSALNDREGGLWLGTSDGLFRVHAAPARTFGVRDGLPDNDAWTIHECGDGTIWVGCSTGAARWRGDRFESGFGATWPGPASCRGIWETKPGETWFAFQGSGVARVVGNEFRSLITREKLGDAGISCLGGDRSGRLWIGNGNGAFAWDNGKLEPWPVTLPAAEGRPAVTAFREDRRGTLWFGTSRHGLLGWREGKTRRFTRRDGLASDSVWSIHEDAAGSLWLGGAEGLTRFVPPTDAGTGWPGTAETFAFGPRHGLPAETINHVLEDDVGFLWMSTLRGVLRVGRAELEAVALRKAERAVVSVFGSADGMESSETNGESQPAGCKTRDGRVWFPTTRGVTVFDPAALPRAERAPTVVIEEVMADDRHLLRDGGSEPEPQSTGPGVRREGSPEVAAPGEAAPVRIDSGRARVVQFRYAAPTFVNAGRGRFRHRLLGMNPSWHEAGEERTANFTNLKPGDYTFEVTACNAHGVWQETPARFAFRLSPSFVQTVWFPISAGSGGVGLAIAMATWRLRWQRRSLRAEQAAALAEERARIARDLHDELGTALTGVGLELEVLRHAASAPESDRLAEAAARTRRLAERMREVVWAVNPHCDTIPSLGLFLEQHAVPFLRSAGIACRLDYPEELPRIPLAAPIRHQLALGVREALANLVRHSHATEAWLRLRLDGDALVVEVADNGIGFDPAVHESGEGHGLANLRARLKAVGGRFECVSRPGHGTRIVFHVPLGNETSPRSP